MTEREMQLQRKLQNQSASFFIEKEKQDSARIQNPPTYGPSARFGEYAESGLSFEAEVATAEERLFMAQQDLDSIPSTNIPTCLSGDTKCVG